MRPIVGAARRGDRAGARPGVAGEHQLAPAPPRLDDLVRADDPPVLERHRLTALERSAFRPGRDAERVRGRDVEASRPLVLEQCVADGVASVQDREDVEHVAVAREAVAGPQLDQRVLVGELAKDPAQVGEQRSQAGRPVDRDRLLAPAHRERLQHAREPEIVVGVVVREEDLAQVDEPHRRGQELSLRSLAAVEEQPLAAAPYEQRRCSPKRGRHRTRRPQEDEIEIHASSMDGPAPPGWSARGRSPAAALAGGLHEPLARLVGRTG